MTELYVPSLPPQQKHPTVFEKFDALQNGESFLLINDHDPIPLYYEMKAERGDVFSWEKLENGPETWKVAITKKGGAGITETVPTEQPAEWTNDKKFVLNVTLIEPKLKHPTIFKHFDALQQGAAFQILNDHDPKPLYYQLIAERGDTFSWEYLENGPQRWQVQITKNNSTDGETVGGIVAKDIRKAEVFKKYGIDFCCGGKKSLQQACNEAKVDIATVEAALQNTTGRGSNEAIDYNRWDADFLADYIYNQHHKYYYEEGPIIAELLRKVLSRHGQSHPYLLKLFDVYTYLGTELSGHFIKEEKVVFPFIKALTIAQKTGDRSLLNSQPSLTEPVQMMEADHEAAGDLLVQIRKLTNNYTPPADSCNSYHLLYKKLEDLEADLHQHIHLENNVLFPKALQLEKSLLS